MPTIEMTNGTIVVSVLPSLGGRVVVLKKAGGENLLDVDEKLLKPPYPAPSLDLPFRPWNGRIVWVGPQSGFWSQQDLKPDLKKQKAVWPPDPFNEAGRFEVVEKTPTRAAAAGAGEPGHRPRLRARVRDHRRAHGADEDDRHQPALDAGRVGPLAEHALPNRRAGRTCSSTRPQMLRMDGPHSGDGDAGLHPSGRAAGG